MPYFRPNTNAIPPVVKNLIIINALMLLATYILGVRGIDLGSILGLHYIESPDFKPYQLVTHMFMHSGIMHLVFNMFALWMFGRVLENVWGPKRFFIFYFVTGLGAAVFYTMVNFVEFHYFASKMLPETVQMVMNQGAEILNQGKNFSDPLAGRLNLILNVPTVGASACGIRYSPWFWNAFPQYRIDVVIPANPY